MLARPHLHLLLLASLALPLGAQAPTVDLAHRTGRSRYALGRLISVRELADGQVVASDSKEGLFRLVDFNHNTVGILGEQGDSAGDYRRAAQMITLPGDSIGMIDAGSARIMHVSASGGIGPFVPMPRATRRLAQLLGADTSGALYFATLPERDSTTHMPSSTQWVTRLAGDGQADVPQFAYQNRKSDQPLRGITPFSFADAVAVRADGLGARVVADSYQVIWYRSGHETGRTGLIPYQPIVISAEEQQAIRDSIVQMFKSISMSASAGGARTVSIGSGGSGGSGAPMAVSGGAVAFDRMDVAMAPASGGTTMTMAAAPAGAAGGASPAVKSAAAAMAGINAADMIGAFPANKPAITSSVNSVIFDNNGMLWIARERVRGDLVPHYDVVAEGRGVVAHVNLPTGTRLIGFGRGVVYLAHLEAGSEYLERYPMPKS
ncbi:MAG TPA: hypothetical protein VGM77_01510 [Gemmatimonadales bacterium]|jgi:hypothetical protein